MTFNPNPHRETLEAMVEGLAGRLAEPRIATVEFTSAGDVDLEVIGRVGAGGDVEAFRHRVHSHELAAAAGPAPLVDGYDRLAARIDNELARSSSITAGGTIGGF